jgi:hypothetical protein
MARVRSEDGSACTRWRSDALLLVALGVGLADRRVLVSERTSIWCALATEAD